MNGDKVALTVAALCATIVMALCFLAEMDGFTVAFRVLATFLAVYVIAWVVVRIIHKTHITDRKQLASALAAEREKAAAEAEGES